MNRRGSVLAFLALILGLVLLMITLAVYVVVWPMMEGTGGAEGLINISESQLNISNYTAHGIIKNTWKLPFAMVGVAAGLLIFYGIVGWKEYGEYSTGGYYG